MHRISLLAAAALSAAMMLSAAAAEPQASPATQPSAHEGMTLRQAADGQMLIGAAIMSHHLDDPALANLIATQFNCITAENEMKPASLHPEPDTYNFEPADKLVAFAEAHQMKVVGHNLLWHNQAPKWLFADAAGKPLPREKALENLRTHINTVMKHFKGHVIGWDVVNEALPDAPGELRDTPARAAIGDDYIAKAFEFARAADPDAELYYNDYNIDQPYKRDRAIALIRKLKQQGVKLDGVGVQGHFLINANLKEIDEGIRALQAEGVKVMITELDVDPIPRSKAGADINATQAGGTDPYKKGLPAELQQQLAEKYGALFKLFKERGVTRVTLWGSHDGTSWLNSYPVRGRTNHPLLFDRQLKPKPAFYAVIEALTAK